MKKFLAILGLLLLLGCIKQLEQPNLTNMVKVQVRTVLPIPSGGLLVLEDGIGRQLQIPISRDQAISISQAGQSPRPLSHDLFINVLNKYEIKVNRVEITSMDDNVFYAALVLDSISGERVFDARPSDAVAIAVRTGAPIFANQTLFGAAPIVRNDL